MEHEDYRVPKVPPLVPILSPDQSTYTKIHFNNILPPMSCLLNDLIPSGLPIKILDAFFFTDVRVYVTVQ
jgi:hypothetical protein